MWLCVGTCFSQFEFNLHVSNLIFLSQSSSSSSVHTASLLLHFIILLFLRHLLCVSVILLREKTLCKVAGSFTRQTKFSVRRTTTFAVLQSERLPWSSLPSYFDLTALQSQFSVSICFSVSDVTSLTLQIRIALSNVSFRLLNSFFPNFLSGNTEYEFSKTPTR